MDGPDCASPCVSVDSPNHISNKEGYFCASYVDYECVPARSAA